MKIGIDLDGVVFDSEKLYRVYAELYDTNELHRNSRKDNREVRIQKRFSWSQEEIDDFFGKYQKNVMAEANLMPGAKKVLKMLKDEGHELLIITARGTSDRKNIGISEELLKQNGIDIFDKYFWATNNKDEVCKQENVDIMIDDSNKKCEMLSSAGIKTIYFKDAPNFDIKENENLKILYNWGEIYRYIKDLEKNGTTN